MEQQGYEEEEEDLYDFSGLSLQDFQEKNAEEDEWMPPTPPPYDIAARLVRVNWGRIGIFFPRRQLTVRQDFFL